MRDIIGNNLLKRLEVGVKPYEVRDTRLKGFILRVQPSGVMTYYAEYGRGKRVRLGRVGVLTPLDAREEAKQVLGDSYKGKYPTTARKVVTDHTLLSFVDQEYSPWAEVHLKTSEATIARLKSSFPDFLGKRLTTIDPLMAERWRTARLKLGRKPSTVNRDLVVLKAMLSKAVEWGFLENHPLASVKRVKVDNNSAPRFLSKDENERLMKTLNERELRIREKRESANKWRLERGIPPLPDLSDLSYADHLKPMVVLSLNTGMRRGELYNLTWGNVDLEKGLLTIEGGGAKSGLTRHIPLNDQAVKTLEKWGAQASGLGGLVFPSKDGKPFISTKKAWGKVLTDAEIKDFRWHDLRHTFASWLVMSGIDINTVRELLGHSDYAMTLRYAHLAPEHKASAVAELVF